MKVAYNVSVSYERDFVMVHRFFLQSISRSVGRGITRPHRNALIFVLILLCFTYVPIIAQDATQAAPVLTVDLTAPTHAISPYIYGFNFANEAFAEEVGLPVNRWGGNATTRYNYQNDISNRASDWYFENIPGNGVNLPDDSDSNQFIEQNIRTGTATLLTIPMIGWTPKNVAYACGFAVSEYGAQQSVDPWQPDCGNGIRNNGTKITGNDPTDTSIAIDPTFVQGWMGHLMGKYGGANSGGVRFYNLDNEPSLWNETHRDVFPLGLSYDQSRDLTYAYGAAIKATDPNAQTLGPVEYGWTAYFYSAKDWEAGGNWWDNPIDRNAHGGTPFVEWYLQQMEDYEQQNGVRILDYLDLHYYPAAPGVTLSPVGDEATQARRLRSTKSLWDPSYTDESWIGTDVGEAVYLIPRMQAWVDDNYPGTKLAITEYNWGGLEHINGALAQADVLGIFGREGLDLATLWDGPGKNQPGAYAFRMYLNYDGVGGTFGDVSVQAASDKQGQLSIYAANRSSDGALTLMVINKTGSGLTSTTTITGTAPGAIGQVYRYSTANLSSIVQNADVTLEGNSFTATYPANSITLIAFESDTTASQLLNNPGFEAAGANSKRPAGWNAVGLNDTDRRLCSNNVFTANTGKCTFRFVGAANVLNRITQVINGTGEIDDTLTLSAFVSGKALTGTGRMILKVQYADNSSAPQQKVVFQKGTYAYQQFASTPLIFAKAVSKITVMIEIKGGGKYTVDDVALVLTPASALIRLPSTPKSADTLRNH